MSTNPFDVEKLGKQAVVDFSQIRKKNIDSRSAQKAEDDSQDEKAIFTSDKDEMRAKLAMARENADNEIKAYKEAVANFSEEISKLVLFKDVDKLAQPIFIDYILDSVIEPTLKGQKPYGVPDYVFREMRREMFKHLIANYEDK